MHDRILAIVGSSVALLFVGAIILSLLDSPTAGYQRPTTAVSETQPAALAALFAATLTPSAPPATTTPRAPSTPAPQTAHVAETPAPGTTPTAEPATPSTPKDPNEVHRVENPYTFDPLPIDQLNTGVRAALVNILCTPRQGGTFSPISGSGVIIDPRGVILTNAHVAQYVLLSQDPRINLQCVIRTGSPARAAFSAEILYISPTWVNEHAKDLGGEREKGTGEHDYALLRISGPAGITPLPASFPFVAPDTRENIGFTGDSVLVASYPAEFLGGVATERDLYAASSVATIGQLSTFDVGTVDVLSLGGIIEAQSGSSGGAVVNPWGRLVGLIVTTSEGATTADRDLHALSLSYVSRDLRAQRGTDLATLLTGNPAQEARDFNTNVAPALIAQYWDVIKK